MTFSMVYLMLCMHLVVLWECAGAGNVVCFFFVSQIVAEDIAVTVVEGSVLLSNGHAHHVK